MFRFVKLKFNMRITKPQTLLSNREDEVLQLVMAGLSTKEIAAILYIDVQTVNTHRRRMMKKTHARNLHEVICFCIVNDIILISALKEVYKKRMAC